MSEKEKRIQERSVIALESANVITQKEKHEILAELEQGIDVKLQAVYRRLEQIGKEQRLAHAI